MIFSIQAKIDEKGLNIDVMDEAFVASFKKAVASIAQATQSEWIRLAQERLRSSKDDYIKGLRQAESFKMARYGTSELYEIQLVGAMPNNFEFGMASFDMKSVRPGWLGGGKAKEGKDGKKYVVIPFSHSTSSNSAASYSGKAAQANLKQELRKAVKQYGLDKLVRTASGKVAEGVVKKVPKGADVHSYLQGMVKIQKGVSGNTSTGLQRGQSQLMTFRIMSENSPASSWQHPGIKPANLLPDVEKYVDNELDKIIDLILGA